MNWAKWVLIGLYVFNLGIDATRHGEPRKGEHNFFVSLLASCIGITIVYFA